MVLWMVVGAGATWAWVWAGGSSGVSWKLSRLSWSAGAAGGRASMSGDWSGESGSSVMGELAELERCEAGGWEAECDPELPRLSRPGRNCLSRSCSLRWNSWAGSDSPGSA